MSLVFRPKTVYCATSASVFESSIFSGWSWRSIHRSTPSERTFSASPGRAPKARRLSTCWICSSGSNSCDCRDALDSDDDIAPGFGDWAAQAAVAIDRATKTAVSRRMTAYPVWRSDQSVDGLSYTVVKIAVFYDLAPMEGQ